jgi:hypothetical protein
MSHTRSQSDDLTPHQRRVLAALFALEQMHQVRWWSRDEIGKVVAAGGYHDTIQRRTIAVLKERDLIQTERSSWPEEVRALVRCGCGRCTWGLTDAGRHVAENFLIKLPPAIVANIERLSYVATLRGRVDDGWDDSQNPWARFEEDDDDDG